MHQGTQQSEAMLELQHSQHGSIQARLCEELLLEQGGHIGHEVVLKRNHGLHEQ